MEAVNWKLISHPMNWITILLMVIIAGSIGHFLLSYLGIEPHREAQSSSYDAMPAGQSPGEEATGALPPQGLNDPYSWASS